MNLAQKDSSWNLGGNVGSFDLWSSYKLFNRVMVMGKMKIMCLFYIVEMKATNERLCKDNNYGMGDFDRIWDLNSFKSINFGKMIQ